MNGGGGTSGPTSVGAGGASERPRRALIVFPGALGDFLLLAPAVAALQAAGTRVELSVRRALAELASAMFPAPMGPPADGAAVATLFCADLDAALAAWLRGADRLDVWFEAADLLERHARALGVAEVRRHRVERGDDGVHVGDAYAAALGVRPIPPHLPNTWVGRAPIASRRRGLVLHPGAGAPAKRWSRTGFLRLADAWRASGGEPIVLLGPAEERERAAWAASGHEVAGGLGLREAAALLASVPWYVGNDSGISHLAGVLERAGVVLFTATKAARWRPLGNALITLACGDLSEDEVSARVLALLERSPGGRLDTSNPRH